MHFLTLASVALTVAAGASAIVIPRSHVHHARIEKPDTYYEGYLEVNPITLILRRDFPLTSIITAICDLSHPVHGY